MSRISWLTTVACWVMASVASRSVAVPIAVPGEYSTIQAAIDAAGPGDEIRIAAGTYDETVRIVGKSIALRADPVGALVSVRSTTATVTIDAGADAVLDGIEIHGGSRSTFQIPAIECVDSRLVLLGCSVNPSVVTGETSQDGLFVKGDSSVRIVGSTLKGMMGAYGPAWGHGAAGTGGPGGRAMVATEGTSITLISSVLLGGEGGGGGATSIFGGTGGDGGRAVEAGGLLSLTIQDCILEGGAGGWGENAQPNPIDPVVDYGTGGAGGDGLYVSNCPAVTIADSTIRGGGGAPGGYALWAAHASAVWGADSVFLEGYGVPTPGVAIHLTEGSTFNGQAAPPTPTPSLTSTPSLTPTETPTPTGSPTLTPTATPTAGPTVTAAPSPTAGPTVTAAPSPTPGPSVTPTLTPLPTEPAPSAHEVVEGILGTGDVAAALDVNQDGQVDIADLIAALWKSYTR